LTEAQTYSFFLGCVMPNRFPNLEASIRTVLPKLGVELEDLVEPAVRHVDVTERVRSDACNIHKTRSHNRRNSFPGGIHIVGPGPLQVAEFVRNCRLE